MTFSTPLRLAGQSLRERREKLFDDFVPYLLIVFAFWIVCMVEWTQKITRAHLGPEFWLFVSVLVTIYGGCRAFRLYPQLRRLRRGEEGERIVAEILGRIRARGFIAYHDLPGEKSNIDHVVVGPAGVFVIETKSRSRSGVIDYRGDNELIFGGRISDNWPLRQARGCARNIRLQLSKELGADLWVKAVVVFVGDWRVRREAGDFIVDVVTTDQLENYFDRQQPELTRKEIAHIGSRLERSARA